MNILLCKYFQLFIEKKSGMLKNHKQQEEVC